jgi:hypothetical protein
MVPAYPMLHFYTDFTHECCRTHRAWPMTGQETEPLAKFIQQGELEVGMPTLE